MVGFRALARGASWSGNERNRLFMNDRGKQFKDVSGVSALDNIADGRVFALLDYDHDGWQDIALLNNNSPSFALYRNAARERVSGDHHYAAFRFVGGNRTGETSETWSNRDGYGLLLTVNAGNEDLHREHRCGEGLSAQNSATMIVGLGSNAQVQTAVVRWPSGIVQQSGPFAGDHLVTVYEDPAQSPTGEAFVIEPYATEAPGPYVPATKPVGESLILADKDVASNGLLMYTTTATWCPNCKAALPHLLHLRSEFSPEELVILGVPVDPDDAVEDLIAYQSKYRPAYELLLNLTADQLASVERVLRTSLHQDGLPATIVTDANGNVMLVSWGVPSVSELRRLRFEVLGDRR